MNLEEFNDFELNTIRRASRKTLLSSQEDWPEEAILNTLARKGPLSLIELERHIGNYGQWEAKRNTIKRRIDKDESQPGLIKNEFINERNPNVRKPGKLGKIYNLTTKGFLASLATKYLSFERAVMFKKYIVFLENKIKQIEKNSEFEVTLDIQTRNMLLEIFKNYIKSQMSVFLIWNEANDMSIRNRREIKWHIDNFLAKHNEYIHQEFPMVPDKKQEKEYRSLLRTHFEYSKMLQSLMESSLNNTHVKKINYHLKKISPFVFKWHMYFDRLEIQNTIDENHNVNIISSGALSPPEYGIDIEYEGRIGQKIKIQPDLKSEIEQKVCKILKKKASVKNIWKTPMRKEDTDNDWLYV